jgi:thiosulfate dehydrogenase [quinone] large subunit
MTTTTTHTAAQPVSGARDGSTAVHVAAGVARLALGWVFLWAFLDKTFGLGYATPSDGSWLEGGSPTAGFLGSVDGTFSGFFNDMAGQGWADWLFMLGLLGIGAALMLGIFVNIAAASGAVMLVLMWLAALPLENNPFFDEHLVYAVVLVLLALMGAGRWLGLGAAWERMPFVQKAPILR